MKLGFWAIVGVLLLLGSLIDISVVALIHEYKDVGFVKIGEGSYFNAGAEALYASDESLCVHASSGEPSLRGKSFIRFDDISFVKSNESASKQNSTQATAGLMEAILFEEQDRVAGSFLKPENMCCTPKLADAGSCNLGELMISADPNDPEWPKRIPIAFKRGEEEVKMSPEAVIINKTGWYTLYFMTCDPELNGTIIRGRSVWKNLNGYLPGDTAPLMKSYGFMFLAYVVLGLVWFPQVARYWKDGIQFHSHISLVIAFSMGELALMYLDLAYLDSTGTSRMEVTLWAITLSSVRQALSRLLLLVISSGYGIVKPTFGGTTLGMLFLGLICFVISESLGLAVHFNNISENGTTFLVLAWAILETCFLQLIFKTLWRTIKKLKLSKRNIAKLQLYKKFAAVLVIMVWLNFVWIHVEVHVYNNLTELWQRKWIFISFRYLLAYVLMVHICFFWAPSEKPTRYLYVAEMEEESEEDLEAGTKNTKDANVETDEGRVSLLEAMILLLAPLER